MVEYSGREVACPDNRHRRVVYLPPFCRRLDKVGETVDKLRSYLPSRLIQLKSEVARQPASLTPNFFQTNACHRAIISALLSPSNPAGVRVKIRAMENLYPNPVSIIRTIRIRILYARL